MAGRETEIAGLAGDAAGAATTDVAVWAAGTVQADGVARAQIVAADPPLAAGAVIDGRYRVIGEIGAGGMGRVYEAEHMFIRRRMALKLLRGGPASSDPGAAARLVQEATLAGQVPHPAVVRVFDCAALGDGQVYLAMELLRGESLEQALRRPGHAAEIVPLLAEVARGLAAVHRVGVVHRDIKPGNIFLARGASGVQAKLLDFGVAKLLPGAAGLTDDAVQTQAGAVLGTPYYLAPEQARGAAIDGRADLYSLGVILYEVLTGALPFVGDGFMEILAQHVRTPPLDPRQAAPARPIPDGVARLTMRLLAKRPDERVADGDALADEIEALLRVEGEALLRLPTGPAAASAEAGTQRLTEGAAEAGTQRLVEEVAQAGTQRRVEEVAPDVAARAGSRDALTDVIGVRVDLSAGTGPRGDDGARSRGDMSGRTGDRAGPRDDGARSRGDMSGRTGDRAGPRDDGARSRGDMAGGTGDASSRKAPAGGRSRWFVGAAAIAALASAVIGWTVVRAANRPGPGVVPAVAGPYAEPGRPGAAPARTQPAATGQEPAPVDSPALGVPRPAATGQEPAPVDAPAVDVPRPAVVDAPAGGSSRPDVADAPAGGDAARPAPSAAAAGRPGKKRPRDGGTSRTPAARTTAEPQLKPDVYDE